MCSQALVTMGCNTVEVRAEPWCLFEVYPEKNVVDFLGIRKENMLKKLEILIYPESRIKDAKLVHVNVNRVGFCGWFL